MNCNFITSILTNESISTLFLLITLLACKHDESEKMHLPSQVYHYVKIDTGGLANKHLVYAPVYSHIYSEGGTRVLNLTATLSVQNISYRDSLYICKKINF